MIVLGLTGSIGMGKSMTASLFRRQGVAVFDADQCVHELYRREAIEPVKARFPAAVRGGVVDRNVLATLVLNDPLAMADLERMIHPLVASARLAFLDRERQRGASLVVVDIPLLFETAGSRSVDVIVVVSANPDEQRRRVLSRAGMTEEKFLAVWRRQTPDEEKRRHAHFVIMSDRGVNFADRQVQMVIAALQQADR
jgi:dephospho-CoA kinase